LKPGTVEENEIINGKMKKLPRVFSEVNMSCLSLMRLMKTGTDQQIMPYILHRAYEDGTDRKTMPNHP